MVSVVDDRGYEAKPRAFTVAQIDETQVEHMLAHQTPLGFTPADWIGCMNELQGALLAVGLTDADVRIRGSAATFFSGPHKPFPKSEEDLLRQAAPDSVGDDEIRVRWEAFGYSDERDLPNYHFFDSRWQLGLASARSDYDIQVSSRELAARMEEYRRHSGVNDLVSHHGGHFKHVHVASVFPGLGMWALTWASRAGRDVNIASFPQAGPGGEAAFRANDWFVHIPWAGRSDVGD